MSKEYKINVYANNEVIARVKYNSDLDYWNNGNWNNGYIGRHSGITKLKSGKYVLIYGSDWQGEKDYGIIITPKQALQEILKSGNLNLLETKKFEGLKNLLESTIGMEE